MKFNNFIFIISEDFVKQKWRNLRDQFQRESKKVKVPFDNPTKPYIHYYRGKWIYFERMLFLKDVTSSKRSSICYSPQDNIEISEEDIKEEIIEFEDDLFAEQVNNYNNESEILEREQSIVSSIDESQCAIEPKVEMIEDVNLENEQIEEIGRKRKASESKSESVVSAKSKRLSVVETTSHTEDPSDIDDDLHFVKSLVPYLRKLSPIRKLLVRNEIQSLLIRESLCEKCKHGTSSKDSV